MPSPNRVARPDTPQATWSCDAGTLTGDSLDLPPGVDATCTIDNDDEPATLTLVKDVVNDDGGTAVETDWTLTADGPTTGVTGATGSDAVTAVPVDSGTYDLSESGPVGYAPGVWDCDAGTLTVASLVLTPGVDATCTIVNDDIPATLTLVKTVTNDNGGTAVETDWTLSADGPTTGVTGATGSDAVTAVPVDVRRLRPVRVRRTRRLHRQRLDLRRRRSVRLLRDPRPR